MKQVLYFILLLVVGMQGVNAQTAREVMNLEIKAKEEFHNNNFYKALQSYLILDRASPHNENYVYPIGVCYVNLFKYSKALPYLEEAKQYEEKLGNSLNYYLAKCYQLNYKFDESIECYFKYLDGITDKSKNKFIVTEIEHEIETCKNAKISVKSPVSNDVENLSPDINSIYPEYGALLSGDEKTIIFTSDRPNTTGGHIYELDGTFYEDIYISHLTDTGWTVPASISDKINTWHHEASIALSHDGHKLLIYRHATDHLLHKSGDLYMSEYVNGDWTKPEHLPAAINSPGWEPSACFSLDDREIYFTSDRKGGFGGTDIYSIRKNKKGAWGKPVNLGSKINTPFNEDSPFLHPDGKTFYFSSQGHKSIGGYDVFVSKIDSIGNWQEPVNVGYPINTPDDDVDFSISADGKRIYFSTDRPGGYGDKDIYFTELNVDQKNLISVFGNIKDSLTNEPLDAKILISSIGLKDNLTRISSSNFNLNGKYIILLNEGFKYEIVYEVEGYNVVRKEINTEELKGYHEKEIQVLMQKK